MSTLLVMYLVGGVGLTLIALPLALRKIKPNPYYGFRVQTTLEDPEIWYAVNEHFGRRLILVGVIEALASIALYLIPNLSLDAYALSVLGVFVIVFSAALAQSWKYMRSLQK